MPDPDRLPRRPRDLDISQSSLPRWLEPKINWVWFAVCTVAVLVLFVLDEQGWHPTGIVPIVLGGATLLFALWLAWTVVIRRGALTWMRLARAPARARARGDAAEAERAFATALARARQFAAGDHRRGLMLFELAGYAKNQGRYDQARELYEECVEALAGHARRAPLDYFAALNNYAIYYIHRRDHAAAQRILERVLDLTLVRRKLAERNEALLRGVRGIEFVLHMNLVVLFLQMHELAEAREQLDEATTIFAELPPRSRARFTDHYAAIRGLVLYSLGRFADAGGELGRVKDPNYPACLWVRARLALVRQEFGEAEGLLRRYFDAKRKEGPLCRPEFRDHHLELAEARHSLGKDDEAFAALAEARAVVAGYALPPDATWRRALEGWLRRAREQGRAEVAAALEAELRAIDAAPAHAIVVSDRLRVRR